MGMFTDAWLTIDTGLNVIRHAASRKSPFGTTRSYQHVRHLVAIGLRVQSISATPLAVYRPAFRSPRSFADVD